MSLHNLAKELERKGRGNDRMLVHMTPREVAGMQALAKATGGSLTVNPHTGLVEAGWLDSVLPIVAGVGLNMMFPGLGALGTAALVGGGTGLATGSVEKGLLAGLGAYGGAGLGGALTGAGTSAGLGAATAEAGAAGEAAAASATEGAGAEAMRSAGLTNEQIAQSARDYAADNTGQVFKSTGAVQPSALAGPHVQTANGIMGAPLEAQGTAFSESTQKMLNNPMSTGTQQLGSMEGAKNVYAAMPTGTLPALGASVMGNALQPEPIDPNAGKKEMDERYKKSPYRMHLSEDYKATNPLTSPTPYRPTGLGYSGYAGGGMTTFDDESGTDAYNAGGVASYAPGGDIKEKKKRATYTSPAKLAAMDPYQAGIASLNNARFDANMSGNFQLPTRIQEMGEMPILAAKGMYLKGGGDGMSDSIPATINGRQPARLADGEFVVPADVVSHLGNGSSNAGAKKLYAMMDKIRTARTGKKKQAPAVNPNKYLPA